MKGSCKIRGYYRIQNRECGWYRIGDDFRIYQVNFMHKLLFLFIAACLTGCVGPYFYKYADPPSKQNHSEITVQFTGDPVVPQAAYFLNGRDCSGLRDLQVSK